jgi:hypothetical protein
MYINIYLRVKVFIFAAIINIYNIAFKNKILSVCVAYMYMYMCTYIIIHTHTCTHTHIYIYIYIQ